jgi:hypothetical protein
VQSKPNAASITFAPFKALRALNETQVSAEPVPESTWRVRNSPCPTFCAGGGEKELVKERRRSRWRPAHSTAHSLPVNLDNDHDRRLGPVRRETASRALRTPVLSPYQPTNSPQPGYPHPVSGFGGYHESSSPAAAKPAVHDHRLRQPAAVTFVASRSARPGPRPVRAPLRGAGRSRHEEPSDLGITGRAGRQRPQMCALPKPPSSGPRARGARTRRRRLYTAEHGGGGLHFVNSSRRNREAGPVPVNETSRSDGSARRVT